MARNPSNSESLLAQVTVVADAIHEQDQAAEAKSERDRALRTNLPLDRIPEQRTLARYAMLTSKTWQSQLEPWG